MRIGDSLPTVELRTEAGHAVELGGLQDLHRGTTLADYPSLEEVLAALQEIAGS